MGAFVGDSVRFDFGGAPLPAAAAAFTALDDAGLAAGFFVGDTRGADGERFGGILCSYGSHS
jgi:hypothetical protein